MIPAEASDTRVRHDWSAREMRRLHDLPITELVLRAQNEHRRFLDPTKVQLCTLLNIEMGGCPQDCAYCPQSAHYATAFGKEKLMRHAPMLEAATTAKAQGFNWFCSCVALRNRRDEAVLDQLFFSDQRSRKAAYARSAPRSSRMQARAGRREMSDAAPMHNGAFRADAA